MGIFTTLVLASMDGVSKVLGGRFSVAEFVWFQYIVVTSFGLTFATRSRGQSEVRHRVDTSSRRASQRYRSYAAFYW